MALAKELRRLNIGLALGAALSVLPWLVPHHGRPWVSFHNEWAMAAALWPLGVWLLWRRPEPLPLPTTALGLAALAAIPLLQAFLGLIELPGVGALAALSLLATAAAVTLGRQWSRHEAAEAHTTLWASLLAAGLLSAGLALAQWLRVDDLGVLLADLPVGAQPTGNIAQANHFGTLQVWALLALWALVLGGRLRPAMALPAAATLLMGAAASQSRTVWLQLALMAVAAVAWKHHLVPERRLAIGLVTLLAGFAGLVLVWPELNAAIHESGGRSTQTLMSSGLRPAIWRTALAAVAEAPFQGWGWMQFTLAHQALALELPPLHRPMTYAHNLVLDLLVWNGAWLGGALALGLLLWCLRRARRVADAPAAVAALGLGTLLIHAQLEMPHAYLYFLFPAGLMAGLLLAQEEADGHPAPAWRVPWAAAGALWAGAAVLLVVSWRDYRVIETRLELERYRAARVGTAPAIPTAEPWLLRQFDVLWPALAPDLPARSGPQRLDEFQRAARHYPSGPLQYRLAQAQALHGQPQDARRTLARLCAMQTRPHCERALAAWRAQAENEPAMRHVELPATSEP